MDLKIDRCMDLKIDRYMDLKKDRYMYIQMDGQIYGQLDRQMDGQLDRQGKILPFKKNPYQKFMSHKIALKKIYKYIFLSKVVAKMR